MLRRGTGDPKAPSAIERETYNPFTHPTPQHEGLKPQPLRGLLKLLHGQIPTDKVEVAGTEGYRGNVSTPSNVNEAIVSVYRYHGPTLRESQRELQKKKRTGNHRANIKNDDNTGNDGHYPIIPHSNQSMAFERVVRRHKFVAFFVVQGFWNATGRPCYSSHTLKLRSILATEYHDVMTTFCLDLGGDTAVPAMGIADEETGGLLGTASSTSSLHPFLLGTGFCLFPTTLSTSVTLALLQISKIPAIVVLDVKSGRIVARDAILAMERNDSHMVVNRWQSGKSGLTLGQQLGAVATCDCSHGPCCSASGGGCCVVQ